MASEHAAPDLGAIRSRMDPLIETLAFLVGNSAALDLKALVTAYDAQAARLAAQQPVLDAVLKLSTYSRETVDAGVQRIVEALGDYEEWLLATAPPGESP